MKNKFWIGFLLGVCGIILGVVGLLECKDKAEKTKFLTGWCLGSLVITGLFIIISLAIIGG